MAAESPRKRLQDEMTCAICLEYFKVPVTLVCGHNFCHACILCCCAQSPTGTFCPLCRRAFQTENLRPNQKLVNLVEITKELDDQEERRERKVCRKHQEPLKLFCKADGALVCIICCLSKEHQGHNIIRMEEAAQEYKELLSAILEALKKQTEKHLANTSAMEEKQMETESQSTSAKFQELQEFLKRQEALTLARFSQVREKIERTRDDLVARLDQELSAYDDLIQEMEKVVELPPCQLFQEARSILQRAQITLDSAAAPSCACRQQESN